MVLLLFHYRYDHIFLYKGVMECAKKCPRYFPSGLEKHFELECYLLSIETLHYYGMQLMAKPEENSGVLYKLGGMIDVHAMSG